MKSKIIQYLLIITILSGLTGGYFYFQSNAAQKINSSKVNNLTSGLVGYWTFDGADTTTATASDKNPTATKNHGTLTGTPKPTPIIGKVGQALSFDGANSYITSSPSFGTVSGYTLCSWIYPKVLSGTHTIAAYNNETENNVIGSRVMSTGRIKLFDGNGERITSQVSTALAINNWYYVCGTLGNINGGNGDWKIYINGNLDNSGTAAYNPGLDTGTYLTIGSYGIASQLFNGSIDEVRVYNRALSQSEITELYQQGQTKINASEVNKLTNGLIHYYTFDGPDMSGDTVIDKVSSGTINGTLQSCNSDPSKPYRSIGKIGQGLTFTSDDNDACVQLSIAFATGTTYSASFWMKPDDSNGGGFLFGAGNSNAIRQQTAGRINFKYSGIDHNSNNNLLSIGNWNHVVVAVDNATATFYINGVADGTVTSVPTLNFDNIGGGGGDASFIGSMDEVRVYDRALSQSEVKELYQQGQTKINASQAGKLTNGLAWYWTMDGNDINWSTNTVSNKVAGGPNGTAVSMNTTNATIGKIGQALDFDGAADYFTFDESGMDDAGAFSISAWVYLDSYNLDATGSGIFTRGGSLASSSPSLFIDYLTGKVIFYISTASGNGDGNLTTNATVSTGQWKHITATWDGTNMHVYLDGVRDAITDITASHALKNVTGPGRVGWTSTGESQYFNGKIDEVRVYNRALSASEVTELYNMGR